MEDVPVVKNATPPETPENTVADVVVGDEAADPGHSKEAVDLDQSKETALTEAPASPENEHLGSSAENADSEASSGGVSGDDGSEDEGSRPGSGVDPALAGVVSVGGEREVVTAARPSVSWDTPPLDGPAPNLDPATVVTTASDEGAASDRPSLPASTAAAVASRDPLEALLAQVDALAAQGTEPSPGANRGDRVSRARHALPDVDFEHLDETRVGRALRSYVDAAGDDRELGPTARNSRSRKRAPPDSHRRRRRRRRRHDQVTLYCWASACIWVISWNFSMLWLWWVCCR